MKQCFSVIIVILLLPIIISVSFLTTFFLIFLDENNYVNILQKQDVKINLTKYISSSIEDSISFQYPDLKNLLQTNDADNAIQTFILKKNVVNQYANQMVGVIKYINGKSPTYNLTVNPSITQQDILEFKDNLVSNISQSLVNLNKCATDAQYDQDIQNGKYNICKPPSLTDKDIINAIRAPIDKYITYDGIRSLFSVDLPFSSTIKDNVSILKSYYSPLKNTIYILWSVIIIFLLILFITNVIHGMTFTGYISFISIFSGIILLISAIFIQLFAYKNFSITGSDIHMSPQYGIQTENSAAQFITNISKNFIESYYISLYIFVIVFVAIFLLMIVINLMSKRNLDKLEFKNDYYIDAYKDKS